MSECSTSDELGAGFNVEGFILDELRGVAHDWCCRRHHDTRPEQILSAYRTQVLQGAADLLDAQELEGAALVRYLSTPHTADAGVTR
ncbi:hypothetical protein ACIQH0_28235 [Streptomyces griseus]|uniref:hypothetical protein n=1 Tax=Streptomyces griseus TaxID=1911 RepID=UPI00380CA443